MLYYVLVHVDLMVRFDIGIIGRVRGSHEGVKHSMDANNNKQCQGVYKSRFNKEVRAVTTKTVWIPCMYDNPMYVRPYLNKSKHN
jgi:hypothetical protein